MNMAILIWFIIFVLMAVSWTTGKIPFWIPIVFWIISVLVRANEKIGNYFDDKKRSERDEKIQLTQKAEEMADRGLAQSGIRIQEENKIKEDFEFERKKAKRKLRVDLADTLFLK